MLVTYHHCPGSCTSIPFTDSVWSFLRTNLGSLNEDSTVHQFYTTCGSKHCNPGITYNLKNTNADTLLNDSSAYAGDQVEAKVAGGYTGLVPSGDSNQYLQIRYNPMLGGSANLFEIDPTIQSYFILHGLTGSLATLNGHKLILPAYAPAYTNFSSGGHVEMDFSLDSAIKNTYPTLYNTVWKIDPSSISFTDSAFIHLRVLPTLFPLIPYGINLLNLRTEFMCKANGPNTSADTIHSCDSWGKKFNIYRPNDVLSWFENSPLSTYCDSVSVGIGINAYGAKNWVSGGDDFPFEFRPYYSLDSTLSYIIPKGYLFSSAQLLVGLDNHDTLWKNNHFSGGWTQYTIPIIPVYRNNIHDSADSLTTLVIRGINNSCWPLIDQKYNAGYYPIEEVVLNLKPVCSAPSTDTLTCNAGIVLCTQQQDTAFQVKKGPSTVKMALTHLNPITGLQLPPTVNEYTDLITFSVNMCDLSSYDMQDGWIAFENTGGYLINIHSATLKDANSHVGYTPYRYHNADSGVIFNIGHFNPSSCDTLVFSAYVDSNSLSCPPPIGGDRGKMVIHFGNICQGILRDPDSTKCQNSIDTLYYNIYPSNLQLTNNGHSPDSVSLCGGELVDSLTITSNDLGTITDPQFWVVAQPGFVVDSVVFRYPCGGARDTNIHTPDTTVFYGGTAGLMGWILNKDLKIHGLMGTAGLPPLSDSNTICVKVYLTMNCDYLNTNSPIVFYASGITTCDILDTADVSITPKVKSGCCFPVCIRPDTFRVSLYNPDAKLLSRAMGHNDYQCKSVLINGTFTVDTTFYFNGCDVSLTPNSLINVINNSTLIIQEGPCRHSCSHLHASACDTMWRGIFVHSGSTLFITDEAVIEDADTAVYVMNIATQQALYELNSSTFNKNYKDIVIKPFSGYYNGYSNGCLYTCRNFDSILTSYPYNCVDPHAIPLLNDYGNWTTAPKTTLLPPHTLLNTYIGWAVDTIGYLSDSLPNASFNTFDNMQYGILSFESNMGIYNDLFQNMVNPSITMGAITAKGTVTSGNKLLVGAPPISYGTLGNNFVNCTSGVIADSGFKYVDIAYNKISVPTTSYGAYGIAVETMNIPGDSLFIDQDTITNYNVGIESSLNNYGTAYINYNVITGNICSGANWTAIALNEVSASHIHYTVDANTIKTLYRGITANGLHNCYINDNNIYLDTMGCSSYAANGSGIALQSCDTAQIGCNYITAGATPNSYTGIVESQSQNLYIIKNDVTEADIGITFSGNPTTGDNLYENTLNTADTGINKPSGTTMAEMGSPSQATDNTFTGISCEASTNPTLGTIYYYSTPAYKPTGCFTPPTLNPRITHATLSCASVPSRSRSHSAIRHEADSTYFDSATITFMENTAQSKDTFYVAQDTNTVIEKEGLLPILWANPYLLNNTVLRRFYDSISNAPMGEILAIDTSMASSTANYSSLLSVVNAINPANNIEANLQTAAQGYLSYRINGTLTSGELATLRTLANKCSDWDGNGVYQVRALLSLFDLPSTFYSDACESHEEHKPIRNSTSNPTPESDFNLYPNPNNGGFTLSYQLQQGQSGTFTIYDMLGKEITTYKLNANTEMMSIDETTLNNGVYLYNIIVNNNVVKEDKLVIIK